MSNSPNHAAALQCATMTLATLDMIRESHRMALQSIAKHGSDAPPSHMHDTCLHHNRTTTTQRILNASYQFNDHHLAHRGARGQFPKGGVLLMGLGVWPMFVA